MMGMLDNVKKVAEGELPTEPPGEFLSVNIDGGGGGGGVAEGLQELTEKGSEMAENTVEKASARAYIKQCRVDARNKGKPRPLHQLAVSDVSVFVTSPDLSEAAPKTGWDGSLDEEESEEESEEEKKDPYLWRFTAWQVIWVRLLPPLLTWATFCSVTAAGAGKVSAITSSYTESVALVSCLVYQNSTSAGGTWWENPYNLCSQPGTNATALYVSTTAPAGTQLCTWPLLPVLSGDLKSAHKLRQVGLRDAHHHLHPHNLRAVGGLHSARRQQERGGGVGGGAQVDGHAVDDQVEEAPRCGEGAEGRGGRLFLVALREVHRDGLLRHREG